jgi:AraC family transcriptional regulator
MINYRVVERPTFEVLGKKTWIAGQESAAFGCFWEQCQAERLFDVFQQLGGLQAGPQTGGVTLGISCVESNPARREFFYFIAIEKPLGRGAAALETYRVPAAHWAVFECRGKVPDAIVQAEIFAFTEWLPASGYVHAAAPELEVYPPGANGQSKTSYGEFWLPILRKKCPLVKPPVCHRTRQTGAPVTRQAWCFQART